MDYEGLDHLADPLFESHKKKLEKMANWSQSPFVGTKLVEKGNGRYRLVSLMQRVICKKCKHGRANKSCKKGMCARCCRHEPGRCQTHKVKE